MKINEIGYDVCSDLCLKQVLLCDDEEFNLMTLTHLLMHFSLEGECFESGTLAVNCFRKRLNLKCCSRTFGLVLTDISMPGLDGYGVCTQITATQNFWFEGMRKQQSLVKFKAKRVTPVVAVTAYTDESTKVKAKSVGMSDLMHKPVTIDRLEKCLKEFYY